MQTLIILGPDKQVIMSFPHDAARFVAHINPKPYVILNGTCDSTKEDGEAFVQPFLDIGKKVSDAFICCLHP